MSKKFPAGKSGNDENINPLDGLVNLADVMLVLVCGLLLALITNWNLDIGETPAGGIGVNLGEEVTETMQGDAGETSSDLSGYEKMGTVYKDPSTGKLYMVTTDE